MYREGFFSQVLITRTQLRATVVDALTMQNVTPATAAEPLQYSPALLFTARGYTFVSNQDLATSYELFLAPYRNNAAITNQLVFYSGGLVRMLLTSAGRLALGRRVLAGVDLGLSLAAEIQPEVPLQVFSDDPNTSNPISIAYAHDDTTGPGLDFKRARNSLTAPANVVNGDILLHLATRAHVGADPWAGSYAEAGYVDVVVDGVVAAGNRPPSRWEFFTNVSGAVQVERLRISGAGSVIVGGSPWAALAVGATDGFPYVPSMAGAPVAAPPTAYGATVPLVVDTAAGRLWAYYGAAWHWVAFV